MNNLAIYKQRNIVERAFCQLRQYRAVATRYNERDFVWRGTIGVASIRIWLRHPNPDLAPPPRLLIYRTPSGPGTDQTGGASASSPS
jgi:hypothetical protein